MRKRSMALFLLLVIGLLAGAQQTQKPPLHGRSWMAITGKPLAATAGARIFQKGGNAVDAACAMLAATCTMWDVLSWGGETQALIYHPKLKKVLAINALGVAPKAATVEFFRSRGYEFPPEYGPLAAVTPGTPGGLCLMLARYGTLSLNEVLQPAMELAAGYPIEAQTANSIERQKERIAQWPYSRKVLLPGYGTSRAAPEPGSVFVQADLLNTLQKMVDAEAAALKMGKSREAAIMAANDRFYQGDIAREFVRGCAEQGGIISAEDLAEWHATEEEPLHSNYKGIEVYKLAQWTQGPMMLQALNMLEQVPLKEMGYNSAAYLHTLYQVMNLCFADRDFYYGDPAFSPEEPMKGLLSKEYAAMRLKEIDSSRNRTDIKPGDPYPFQGAANPYQHLLRDWPHSKETEFKTTPGATPKHDLRGIAATWDDAQYNDRLWRGTTTIEAADSSGWVVSVTPSGGWIPACIAGNTGVGMSQRMQSFVLSDTLNPFNVLAPGKRPRVTLTPTLALKDGHPYLAFGVQGGDTQDQNLLQFFLNVVEFGMTVQQAAEAANMNTNQLWLSLGGTQRADRQPRFGQMLIHQDIPETTRAALRAMGYQLKTGDRTSGPINAIYFDRKHGTFWGGSSNHGEDYGICW